MTLRPGMQLGPYEILAPLGAGGMGEVYSARDSRLGRKVALKVLPPSFADDPDRLRRFELEARAIGALNHPNLLTIHDVGSHEGRPYLVCELLEGSTLRQLLASGPVGLRDAVDWGIQLVAGLAAAHEKGVVHRDLKPENVFVTREGRAKILDFGLAKLMSPLDESDEAPTRTSPTMAGTVLGTVGYMSPEQVRGRPADERSDIFSFGAVLYEMLSGRRAFTGEGAVETQNAILHGTPPVLSGETALVPQALARVVERCLEKRPDQRFRSAQDIGYALQALSGDAATSPTPRRRWRPVAAVGIVAALAGLAWWGLRAQPSNAPSIRSIAVMPLANLSGGPDQEFFADGMTEALIGDLTRIEALRVISRTSVMQFKDTSQPLPEIGKTLQVDGIVEGAVIRAGGRVRVSAKLVEAATERSLWSGTYERDERDLLELIGEVSRSMADEIRLAVTPAERARLAGPRPVQAGAYEAYARGLSFLNQGREGSVAGRREESLRRSVRYFEQALDADPGYASAYAALARAYHWLASGGLPEFYPKAKEAALAALRRDDGLGEAHAALAFTIYRFDWDWSGAQREFRRAIELNPGYSEAHAGYAVLLSDAGKHDAAIAELKRAEELDPLTLPVKGNLGLAYYCARRYDDAIRQFHSTLELDPNRYWLRGGVGATRARQGRFEEAMAEVRKSVAASGHPRLTARLGQIAAAAGETRNARQAAQTLEHLWRKDPVAAASEYASLNDWRLDPDLPIDIAVIHAALGDRERALGWLEIALRARAPELLSLVCYPEFDGMRGDARFESLRQRVGIPR